MLSGHLDYHHSKVLLFNKNQPDTINILSCLEEAEYYNIDCLKNHPAFFKDFY
jgi:hypothetical protein